MLREVGCRLPAQSARMRAQQPTCQLGHVIGVQAQSTRLHAGNRTGPANPPLGISTIRAQQPTCQLGLVIGVQAQSTRLHARQPHQSRQSAACHQHNPRVCAHSSAGSSSVVPAVMRYGPHTCTHDNSQRCFPSPSRDAPPVAHSTAAPPPQHVSCMKMRYASWLD